MEAAVIGSDGWVGLVTQMIQEWYDLFSIESDFF